MRRAVRFRSCLIRTVFSSTLDQWVRTYIVDESNAIEILGEIDLETLSREDYINLILNLYVEGFQQLRIREGDAAKVKEELFGLCLEENPYLAPRGLEQLEVQETPRRRRRKTEAITEAVEIYQRVKQALNTGVAGQEEAVASVIRHVGRGLMRSQEERRPICALLFAGLSGTGKTHVARTLAQAFGDEKRLIRIDCGEYGESHQAARLLGSPAGYVGFEEGSFLEQRLDPSVYQVLLFDEFEKAHRKVWNLLLAALEEGEITTSKHESLSLRNCVVILTSNLGTREMSERQPGFGDRHVDAKAHIRKELPVELVNRLTDVLIFQPLSVEEKERIAELELAKLQDRIKHLCQLRIGIEAKRKILRPDHSGSGEQNGRTIRKRVDEIHAQIAEDLLEGRKKIGGVYEV